VRHAPNPLAALALIATAACGSSSSKNVVELAQSSPDLSILVEAVEAADLQGTLSGTGPYTVFAPTNAAFADLLAELGVSKDELLADKPLLTSVLTYHVLAGRILAAQIPLGKALDTVQGDVFKIDRSGAGLVITDGRNRTAGISRADLRASNGVVHVVDRVLLPADKDLVQTAQSIPDFSILVDAVVAAGLQSTLSGAGPFTVFAPTNAAFADLLAELGVTKDELLSDVPLLTKVLTYHVLAGRVMKADVVPGVQPATVEGETFSIDASLAVTDQRGRIAHITATDVFASNGVIHVLDKVILPAP
jgi:uncharacterized surface protein with fasciclin (FAS1) repeats